MLFGNQGQDLEINNTSLPYDWIGWDCQCMLISPCFIEYRFVLLIFGICLSQDKSEPPEEGRLPDATKGMFFIAY